TPLVIQHQAQVKLREENQYLRRRVEQLDQLAAENEQLSNLVAQSKNSVTGDRMSELLRLRGEVGVLRRQTNELAKLRAENRRLQASLANAGENPQKSDEDPAAEQRKEEGIAKLNYSKHWLLAFMLYAADNEGRFPASFDQAMAYFPDRTKV